MTNHYTKIGLSERGRLQTQFKKNSWIRKFYKSTVTHYPGQTKRYIYNKYKNTNKIILYLLLGAFMVINFVLLGWMKVTKQKTLHS